MMRAVWVADANGTLENEGVDKMRIKNSSQMTQEKHRLSQQWLVFIQSTGQEQLSNWQDLSCQVSVCHNCDGGSV